MRGIIYRAYLDFIESRFGYDTVDALLEEKTYPNRGGFSSAGNYDPRHLLELIRSSTRLFDNSEARVLEAFGAHAFAFLAERFRSTYHDQSFWDDPYDFLEHLNTLHFDELHKLYPDASFPRFDIDRSGPKHIIIRYASPLGLHHFVLGLIRGCLAYYNEDSGVTMTMTGEQKSIDGHPCPVSRFEVGHDGL